MKYNSAFIDENILENMHAFDGYSGRKKNNRIMRNNNY